VNDDDDINNKFIPKIQRITFFMSKEPALRLAGMSDAFIISAIKLLFSKEMQKVI
jgi:hypothetical protein